MSFGPISRAVCVVALFALAACDTAEERAQEHFESGQKLLEAGDVDRAVVEFRNVFRLNEDHVQARLAFARIMEDRGNLAEAYANYLRAIEIEPDLTEGRVALAEMALLNQSWDEARRHATPVIEAAPDSIDARLLDIGLRFRDAAVEDDAGQIRELTREATALLDEAPESEILLRIMVEGFSRDGNFDRAVETVDTFIAREPDNREMHQMRLSLLARTNDTPRIEAQIRDMVAQFPDDAGFKQTLIQLLLRDGRTEDARDFLSAQADVASEDPNATLAYIGFIRMADGEEAALAATEAAIDRFDDDSILRALKASLLFDAGSRDEAITLMEATIEDAGDAAQTNQFRVGLAKMLQTTGNETGAREIIDTVLTRDASNVDALKMKAAWQTEDDRVEEAIQSLRLVLDQAPEDAQAMTLLAAAHRRAGNPELSRELLSLAVQASQNGRAESLRFARVLLDEESFRSAEDVLVQALRKTPNDTEMLRLLGQIYVESNDFARASGVETSLRRGDADAQAAAESLRLALVGRRDGDAQALAYLEDLARQEGAGRGTRIALLRARLAEDNAEGALSVADDLLSEDPDNQSLKLLVANTRFAVRDFAGAEAMFRDVLENEDAPERAFLQLIRVVSAQGRPDEARALIDEGIARFGETVQLLWAKASDLEQRNDIDGAIEIYESLYSRNPNALVLANNLASMLATYRDDDESLDRAWTVARRLAGTETPAFQDTYGWIAYRRGDIETALEYLAPASLALNDPIVDFHYATALEAANQPQDALAAYRKAVDGAADDDQRPQLVSAREAIARLSAEGTDQ